jgi:hypothetical protein
MENISRQDVNDWCDTRSTDREIGQAILEVATDDDHADAIWMADYTKGCTNEIIAKVEARAWELCNKGAWHNEPGTKLLHWGDGTLER